MWWCGRFPKAPALSTACLGNFSAPSSVCRAYDLYLETQMKRLFIIAAFSIALLTLLAACGSGSPDDPATAQGTTSSPTGSTGIQPPPTETAPVASSPILASVVDPEGNVQRYLDLMDQLAGALRSSDTTDLSPAALEPITAITSQLEGFQTSSAILTKRGETMCLAISASSFVRWPSA